MFSGKSTRRRSEVRGLTSDLDLWFQEMRILITGGAGFIGSNLALATRAAFPAAEVVCMDNLHRRGSELNVPRLAQAGANSIVETCASPASSPRGRSIFSSNAPPSRPCWRVRMVRRTICFKPTWSALTIVWRKRASGTAGFCFSPPAGFTRSPGWKRIRFARKPRAFHGGITAPLASRRGESVKTWK